MGLLGMTYKDKHFDIHYTLKKRVPGSSAVPIGWVLHGTQKGSTWKQNGSLKGSPKGIVEAPFQCSR
jgi:hypothetical protein